MPSPFFVSGANMHIVTVAGIRPDFIRLSEIIRRLDSSGCEHTLIHTGQHFDNKLSQVFFEELEIRQPDYNLGCGGGDHTDQMVKLVPAMRDLLAKIVDIREPHLIVFLGDSNSVLVAPFLKKEGYKIAHIEALMRSHDMRMLEETNRICCDSVSDLLLTYHKHYLLYAADLFGSTAVVGNTIVEPTLKHMPKEQQTQSHILVDIHRPENFKDPERMDKLLRICSQLKAYEQIPVYFLEFPRTMKAIADYGLSVKNLDTISLMGYKDHLKLQYHSKYIISDSGTDQEQPSLLRVPVFVPRIFTERPESYLNYCSCPLSIHKDNNKEFLERYAKMMRAAMNTECLYADDDTSKLITDELLTFR
jgi:UDP-N-acetylglucosamine 2-epimerase (non-hydrolysing)